MIDGWVRTPFFDWKLKGPQDYRRLNFRYQVCLKRISQAKAEADWRTYIALHLPEYREHALFEIQEFAEIPHPLHNQLVGEIWNDPAILHPSSCFVLAAMRSDVPHDAKDLMTQRELAAFYALPAVVIAFRSHQDWNQMGSCWTLEESIAERFAGVDERTILTAARIPRDQVIAYFDRREEAELIVRNHLKTEIVFECEM